MPYYIVRQGDCINAIAELCGFFWETLWNHTSNTSIREQRENPNVLMPGDRIFVPDKTPKDESGATGLQHVFRMKGIPCRFNLRLLDHAGVARAGLAYTLDVDGKQTSGKVPEDGMISEIVSQSANKAVLTLQIGPGEDETYTLMLAHLNPVTYPSGVQARLKNLGYMKKDPSGQMDDETRDALKQFQERSGLPVTGDADEQTKSTLAALYGC
jgi:N-acetylmuramoyl-L-alanine amidase